MKQAIKDEENKEKNPIYALRLKENKKAHDKISNLGCYDFCSLVETAVRAPQPRI